MAEPIDPTRARNPVSGPALLFFSGGTALRNLSRQLVKVSHRSLHVITPFDNGGSSAELRRHYRMLPPGDLRNRMLALADFDRPGVRDTHTLLNTRLESRGTPGALHRVLEEIVLGQHPRTRLLPRERKQPLLKGLSTFLETLPAEFSLGGASVGNLVFTGLYLGNNRDLAATLAEFGELLSVRGTVHPAADCDLDLSAELLDGRVIQGQRGLTGREGDGITAPVNRIWTSDPLTGAAVEAPPAAGRVLSMIASADLIVYPYGSFWTSLVASLLPQGIVAALARSSRPKVWVPSTYEDPELPGIRLEESLDRLLRILGVEPGSDRASRMLDTVIVDPRNGRYTGGLSSRALRARKIEVLEAELVSPESSPAIDPGKLLPLLLKLA